MKRSVGFVVGVVVVEGKGSVANSSALAVECK